MFSFCTSSVQGPFQVQLKPMHFVLGLKVRKSFISMQYSIFKRFASPDPPSSSSSHIHRTVLTRQVRALNLILILIQFNRGQCRQNKCYRRMLGISCREHKTNECVWQQANILAGRQQLLLSTVKHRTLSWFGHVCRRGTLPKIIIQGTVEDSHNTEEDRMIMEGQR